MVKLSRIGGERTINSPSTGLIINGGCLGQTFISCPSVAYRGSTHWVGGAPSGKVTNARERSDRGGGEGLGGGDPG